MSYQYVGMMAPKRTAELLAAEGGLETIQPISVKRERAPVLALGHSDI